ncbi:MAG: MATE family efflux transporter [Planctomycetes bacterium]|nr:MATE family efflux transporter [Planctomycetota bacterium]MBI3833332.1 MATE family efflux transporter [Planctomycetota bacterium]
MSSLDVTLEEPPKTLASATDHHHILTGPVGATLLRLALPVLAEQFLNTLVVLSDSFLAGRISRSATAAVGLGTYVGWLVSMLCMLVGTGTTAIVARRFGEGNKDEANHFANQSLTLAGMLGAVLFVLMYSLAPWFAHTSNMTGETYDIAVTFLRIDAVGHMFLSVVLVGCAALRGAGNMRTPMMLFVLINIVNTSMSWILTYGLGPIRPLGVNGIVCGTVIAYTVGIIALILIYRDGRAGLKLRLHQLFINAERAWGILRIGIPAAADGLLLWIGQFTFISIIARIAPPPLGEVYFAAHFIAVRVEAFTYLPAVAWASATATMIGQALGAGDIKRARRVGTAGVLQGGVLAVFIGLSFFIGADVIFRCMSTDLDVRATGVGPFRILACFQPLLVCSIVFIGGLRGAGDTRYPLLITMVGALLLRVPLGYIGGIVLHGGLLGAWMGMFADMTWRAIAGATRYYRGRWVTTRV